VLKKFAAFGAISLGHNLCSDFVRNLHSEVGTVGQKSFRRKAYLEIVSYGDRAFRVLTVYRYRNKIVTVKY
jgi:hypothetical protein